MPRSHCFAQRASPGEMAEALGTTLCSQLKDLQREWTQNGHQEDTSDVPHCPSPLLFVILTMMEISPSKEEIICLMLAYTAFLRSVPQTSSQNWYLEFVSSLLPDIWQCVCWGVLVTASIAQSSCYRLGKLPQYEGPRGDSLSQQASYTLTQASGWTESCPSPIRFFVGIEIKKKKIFFMQTDQKQKLKTAF